ncbi:helix-turn-helix domain-containing protein [Sulfitobacter sp. R18_1]|nr:helix-turn-helix domain-containing protein [Sulfitobacter sp. R18_1]
MPKLKPLTRSETRARRQEVFLKACAGELALPSAVREIRKSLGMTQAIFAKHFGLTRIQVIDLEKGKANPTLETLMKIGRPFGFQVGFIPKNKPPEELLSRNRSS